MLVLSGGNVAGELMALMDAVLANFSQRFFISAPAMGSLGWCTGLLVTVLAQLAAAALGVLAEYLHAEPIFSGEKITPEAEHLNPVEASRPSSAWTT